jgi:hypothetical protein
VSDERMIIDEELGGMWKEAVMALLRYYTGICLGDLGKLRKISVRIAGVPTEIRTEHFPSTSLELYPYTRLFGIN